MLKRLKYALLLLLFLAACHHEDELKVVRVKDGDTIVVLTPDHQSITVRLAEIDCPEKSQPYGKAAKQFTADLCFGKSVKLEVRDRDRYGRTVAVVLLDDGTNVNYELVKNGYAWQYKYYSKDEKLAELEEQAREQHLGLWQEPNPEPPWEYRREKRREYAE